MEYESIKKSVADSHIGDLLEAGGLESTRLFTFDAHRTDLNPRQTRIELAKFSEQTKADSNWVITRPIWTIGGFKSSHQSALICEGLRSKLESAGVWRSLVSDCFEIFEFLP